MQDSELLREYLQKGSEAAFAELVKRYVDLVFATARRHVGDAHLAEEVSQTVFCLLARKAGSLTGVSTLAGWLYRATCFSAAKALRTELRRRCREQEAAAMNSQNPNPDETWEHIGSMLDDALNELTEKDRLAVLLRFFQRKPMRQVGEALGVSEAAAKMRIGRSVERLRAFFVRRGVACSAVGLAAFLTDRAAKAAPANLAPSISAAALSGVAAVGASGMSLLQLLLLMTGLKAKTLMLAGAAAILLLAAGWHTYTTFHRSVASATRAQQVKPSAAGTGSNLATRFRTRAATIPIAEDLAEAIANLRAALHSTNHSQVPGSEVVDAIQRFGPHAQVAFEILKEEAGAHDETRHSADNAELAPHRAICGMGFLGKSVPEAAAFLWATFNATPSTQSDSVAFLALSALDHLGFEPRDIATLAQKVLAFPKPAPANAADGSDAPGETLAESATEDAFVKSEVAGWMAATIKQQPAATAPFLSVVQNLLSSPDEGTRFWVACALLQSQGAENPALLATVAAGLKSGDKERLAWASQMLQGCGDAARPLAPALLEAAQASTDHPAREWAFLAAGKLAGELRSQVPEVDHELTKEESDQSFLDKVNSGTYTGNDLVAALKDPGSAVLAATLLGEMGPSATNALSALFTSFSVQPQGDGTTILVAIRKIDPQAAVAPEEAVSIATTFIQSLQTQPSQEAKDALKALEEEHWQTMAWCTRAGFPEFASRLAARNPDAYSSFVAAVLEKAPTWKDLLQSKPTQTPLVQSK